MSLIFEGEAYQNAPNLLLGRFCAPGGSGAESPVSPKEGNLIKVADVSSISVKAFNTEREQQGTTQSPAASSVILDTFQTDGIWLNVYGGGNFKYLAPASFYPEGSDNVQVEVILTLTDGTKAVGLWNVQVTEVLG